MSIELAEVGKPVTTKSLIINVEAPDRLIFNTADQAYVLDFNKILADYGIPQKKGTNHE